MSDEDREVTSVRVNPELWKRAKHEAIDKDIGLADLVEQALRIRLDPEAERLVEKYRTKGEASKVKARRMG